VNAPAPLAASPSIGRPARTSTGADSGPSLVVAEVFGATIQGEGPSTGRRCGFIRTGGCNLHCEWCDTPYTWDAARFDLRAELQRRPVADIAGEVAAMGVGLVVITGGEPLLHQAQPGWLSLLDALTALGIDVEIETNGTVVPTVPTMLDGIRFNVSPKLAHAGDPESARIRPDALARFANLARLGRASFKFVARSVDDLPEIADLVVEHDIPADRVWVMPEGTTADDVLAGARHLADPVIAAGWNLTTRLHTLVWGQERAR
jgi:7-carboxy-7-deazaguanine synthase